MQVNIANHHHETRLPTIILIHTHIHSNIKYDMYTIHYIRHPCTQQRTPDAVLDDIEGRVREAAQDNDVQGRNPRSEDGDAALPCRCVVFML